jgi:hypothetical protein
MIKNVILILSFLIICSSSYCQKVTVDVDESVDFSNFKSYQFLGWQDDSDKIINDLDKKRLRDSFESELTARQLEQVELNLSLQPDNLSRLSLEQI